MKKLVIVLLILMTASVGLFAQLTPSGTVRLDFGGSTVINDGELEGAWTLDALAGSGFGLKGQAGDVTGSISFDLGGAIDAVGSWNAGGLVDVSAGYTWLPSAYWSSLAIWGNNNYGIGATSVGRASFIKLGVFGAYLGIAGQTGSGGGWNNGGANVFLTDESIPVIFAGYEFDGGAVSAGVSATVWKNGDELPMLFTLHGKYDAGMFAVGLNAGFHIAPGLLGGLDPVTAGSASGDFYRGGTKDDMAVEGMLDFSVNLDPAVIAVTVGYVHNFAEKAKRGESNTLQAGLSATIGLGNGFDLIPGVVYTNYLKDAGAQDTKLSKLDYGVSLAYSF